MKQSVKAIRDSLNRQLQAMGASVPHFEALVEDYCKCEEMERKLYKSAADLPLNDPNAAKIISMAINYDKQKIAILKQLGLTTKNCDGGEYDKL